MYQAYIKRIFAVLMALFCAWGFYLFFFDKSPGKLEKLFFKQAKNQKLQSYVKLAANEQANNEPFQEGKHYQKLSAKITTTPVIQALVAEDTNKIQVIEFFNYACFWCRKLHPELDTWHDKEPPNVAFRRYPIVFGKGWEVLAKAYYVVEMLQKNRLLDKEFFKAVHEDSIDLTQEKLLQAFFEKQGIPEQKFKEIYESFAVARKLTYSNEVGNAYQIVASPAVIINSPSGSYLITPNMAGDQGVLKVMDYLIARETKLLKKASQH